MPDDVGISITDDVGWSYGDAVGVEGSLETLMYALFNSKTTITNIVSTRIFVSTLPNRIAYPTILYTRILGEPLNVMTERPRLQKVQMQIDSYATSYQTAYELSTVIHRIMDSSTTFKSILTFKQDASEVQPDMKRLYNIRGDYSCFYKT